MKRHLATILFAMLAGWLAGELWADSYSIGEFTCPIDRHRFLAWRLSVYSTMGCDDDLSPVASTPSHPLLSSLVRCPKCGFAAPQHDYDNTNKLDVARTRAALAVLKGTGIFTTIDAAAVVERNWCNNPIALAELSLAAKMLADSTGEPEVIRQRLQAAIDAHLALFEWLKTHKPEELSADQSARQHTTAPTPTPGARQTRATHCSAPAASSTGRMTTTSRPGLFEGEGGEVATQPAGGHEEDRRPTDLRAVCCLRIATFQRQLGRFRLAEEWYLKVRKFEPTALDEWIELGLFRARYPKPTAEELIAVADSANERLKRFAIESLARSDDPRAVEHVKELFLQHELDLEEPGEWRVDYSTHFGPPRAGHMEIYVAGLTSGKADIRWRSAMHLAAAKDRRALPVLRELLRENKLERKEANDAVLAVLELSDRVEPEWLNEQLSWLRPKSDEELYWCLKSKSPKFLFNVVWILKECFYGGRNNTRDTRSRAGDLIPEMSVFGQGLLDELPDLASCCGGDPLAVLKVRLLALCDVPGGADQLRAAYHRSPSWMVCSASMRARLRMALADCLPKECFGWFRRRGAVKLEAALALLAKGDDRGRDWLVEHITELVYRQPVIGYDYPRWRELLLPRLMPSDFQVIWPQFNRDVELSKRAREKKGWPFQPSISSDTAHWLDVLAATHHPRARKFLLDWFHSGHITGELVTALLWFWDDPQVRDLLTREDVILHEQVLARLAETRAVAMVPRLLEAVREPTGAATKIHWIRTMVALDARQAGPTIQRWTDSPNPALAAAARAAVDKFNTPSTKPAGAE